MSRELSGANQPASEAATEALEGSGPSAQTITRPAGTIPQLRLRTLIAVPVAVAIALGVHAWAGKDLPGPERQIYFQFLGGLMALSILAALVQLRWRGLRPWMRHLWP